MDFFPAHVLQGPSGCCSWNFYDCGDSDWCNQSSENCYECTNGYWIDPSALNGCTPQYESCLDDLECCGGILTTCQLREGDRNHYYGCDLAPDVLANSVPSQNYCCSWNFHDCGSSNWCNQSKENCVDCGGYWIDLSLLSDGCTPLYESCLSSEECCGGTLSSCQERLGNHGGFYNGCDLAPDPIAHPTTSPSVLRSMAGPPPTSQPGPIPPVEDILYPSGPYMSAAAEHITIPKPKRPKSGYQRTACPHYGSNLLDWHDPATWGGSVPEAGDDATLPPNSRILLSRSVGQLRTLTIPPTSELVIGESDSGIRVDVKGMDVQGSLTAGSSTCRLEKPVIITLHGSRPLNVTVDPTNVLVKGISVTGTLDLHGKRYFPTWTRLAKTIRPGESFVMLQDDVNWEEGQNIVLVTTAMKDSREWHRNEVLTISSVRHNVLPGVGSILHLSSPAVYEHAAYREYQGEVGLLSRMIKIQGDDRSEPSDPDPLTCTSNSYYVGDNSIPCPNTYITGYGGHVIIQENGRGYIEGIELFRMGQTNILGRYPVHFHLLGDCPECYFRESSVHRSFYRCVSIHGTNQMTVSENVAYDIVGFCYYMEDGVEIENTISFNLGAHIHLLGLEPVSGVGQQTRTFQASDALTLPADVAAAAFYITNVHNNIIGNVASGGWAGFAFPNLPTGLQTFSDSGYRPLAVTSLTIDGNTAHSTGWWWTHAGGFYFGGTLYYNDDGQLEYNPGRSFNFEREDRESCEIPVPSYCPEEHLAWIKLTNTKVFLIPGSGLNSWSGRMEIISYESHDVGLTLESLSNGFWADNMLAVCRTGHKLDLPAASSATFLDGNGFFFYDTGNEHIITNSTFRNCGYRSPDFDQYDTSPLRGCGDDPSTGCASGSTVFGFLTHSDTFNPEIMQGTREITFHDCGRRFKLHDFRGASSPETVSGRLQNWLDIDGSVSGLNEPTLIGSGLEGAKNWWTVDDAVLFDEQGPLRFIKQKAGPRRGVGHVRVLWDEQVHAQVDKTICENGGDGPCPALGNVRHMGRRFSSVPGLPMTAASDIAGPVGGFGWILTFNGGGPRSMRFEDVEVRFDTPLILSIPYPPGTTFTITANAAPWCSVPVDGSYICAEEFQAAYSMDEVRFGNGNTYYVDMVSGAVTFRIVQTPSDFIGNPDWFVPTFNDVGRENPFALTRFERSGVLLPRNQWGAHYTLEADCPGSGVYCEGAVGEFDPDVCPPAYSQTAYDACCSDSDPAFCIYADGSTNR